MTVSYFTADNLTKLVEEIHHNNEASNQLAEALVILEKQIKLFPYEDDPTRYTVEFIYPH